MNIPSDLLYTREHEWLKVIDDDTALIGITDYAQNSLGDITFVELPKAGRALKSGATFGVVESVKAASDLYAPVDAVVLECNETAIGAPDSLNRDPYESGWLLRVKLADKGQLAALLSPADYATHTAG
jgi:glycine cleavage system H protein